MKIAIKGERTNTVIVKFIHHNIRTFKPYTFATVELVNNDSQQIFISTGQAYLHPNDIYDKRIGRKLALSRALKRRTLPAMKGGRFGKGCLPRE